MNLAQVAQQGPFQDKVLNAECVLASTALTLCLARSGPVLTDTPQRNTGWAGKVKGGILITGLLCISWSQGPHELRICLATGWQGLAHWGMPDEHSHCWKALAQPGQHLNPTRLGSIWVKGTENWAEGWGECMCPLLGLVTGQNC